MLILFVICYAATQECHTAAIGHGTPCFLVNWYCHIAIAYLFIKGQYMIHLYIHRVYFSFMMI